MTHAAPLDASAATPSRFSRGALLALRDAASVIQCECPNHVAELVPRLLAFEEYSKTCENRDDADARIHHALWQATMRARVVMEDALEMLMRHEGFVVSGSSVTRLPATAS